MRVTDLNSVNPSQSDVMEDKAEHLMVCCEVCGKDFNTNQLVSHVGAHELAGVEPLILLIDHYKKSPGWYGIEPVRQFPFLLDYDANQTRRWRYRGRLIEQVGFSVQFTSKEQHLSLEKISEYWNEAHRLKIKLLPTGVGLKAPKDIRMSWRVQQFYFICEHNPGKQTWFEEADVSAADISEFISAASATCSLRNFPAHIGNALNVSDFDSPDFVGGGGGDVSKDFSFA